MIEIKENDFLSLIADVNQSLGFARGLNQERWNHFGDEQPMILALEHASSLLNALVPEEKRDKR